MNSNEKLPENVVAGIVGAMLFSLSGAVVYFLLSKIGFVSFISGFVGVVLACKGYSLFAKGESVKGMVISIIFATLSIILGWYCTWVEAVYDAGQIWFENGDIDYEITIGEAFLSAIFYILDPEFILGALGDLALGLLFAVGGGAAYAANQIKRIKAQQKAAQRAASTPYGMNNQSIDQTYSYKVDEPKEQNENKEDENK